jgi:indole-3-glycerol phosphate synthase
MMLPIQEYRLPPELRGTILDQIMRAKLPEIAGAKKAWPAACIENVLGRAPEIRSLRRSLLRRTPAILAEIKQASPSAGLLRSQFNAEKIALEYEEAGAAAISVVTEVAHFHGGIEILANLRWRTRVPLLRKDFIVDPYQVIEARHAGADAVLLIEALLEPAALEELRILVESLGMDALVEVHSRGEMERALAAGATLIGVNNRNLRTFEVSLEVCLGLAEHLPKQVVAVAESGIRSSEDIRRLADAGYRGFLVGEQLMRSPSPGQALAALLPAGGIRRVS